MRKSLTLLLLAPSLCFAEFTPQEKSEAQEMAYQVTLTRWVTFYAADELANYSAWYHNRTGSPPTQAQQDLADSMLLNIMDKAQRASHEGTLALGGMTGSLNTALPWNRPLEDKVSQSNRYAILTSKWSSFENVHVPNLLAAVTAYAPIAEGVRMQTTAATVLGWINDRVVNLSCCTFTNREPSWYPFLVRRISDGEGTHGHFNNTSVKLATSLDYLHEAMFRLIDAGELWNGSLPQNVRGALRATALAYKDAASQLENIRASIFNISPLAGGDEFSRLFAELETFQIKAMMNMANVDFIHWSIIFEEAAKTSQPSSAWYLGRANNRWSDGWKRSDEGSWEATRFPCYAEEPASAGCLRGFPTEGIFP